MCCRSTKKCIFSFSYYISPSSLNLIVVFFSCFASMSLDFSHHSIPFNSIQFQPIPFSFGHKNKRTFDVCERSEMCGFCCCRYCCCVRKSRGSSRQNIIINANALSRHNCKFCLSVFIMMVWLSQTIASNLFITLKRYT